MTITVRSFQESDYDAQAAIHNANYPDHARTAGELRYEISSLDPRNRVQRWIAEVDRQPVGYGLTMNIPWSFDPQRFLLILNVHPQQQGRGVGALLYRQAMTALHAYDPIAVLSRASETHPRGLRFLTDRGFVEDMRVWESKLDTADFDWSPYADIDDRMREQGIEITSLRDLADDPERDRKLYDLATAIGPDLPGTTVYIPQDFETVTARRNNDPNLLSEAYFVALHNGHYVGTSAVFNSQSNEHLWTGLTGTLRPYRRKGIALALKLRVIRYAQEHNRRWIYTDNASTNRPMLAINEQLGFQRLPAWIWFTNTINEDT